MNEEVFSPDQPLSTAVLFLVFNRLDTTKLVFEEIRKAKPPRFYVAADGARTSRNGEAEKVRLVRQYVIDNIDWDCEVKTLFREKNKGCKYAVSEAISWFFENEEMGIILEDDCLPNQSFFWFCEELLERFRDDERVGQISGDNFQNNSQQENTADYYFSIYNHIWGWASWADRWKRYDVELDNFESSDFIKRIHESKKAQRYWVKIFHDMKAKKIDTWDYQWTFSMWSNNWLTVLPNVNLVSNIGFGIDATHTTGFSKYSKLPAADLKLKRHPENVVENRCADDFTFKSMFSSASILRRIFDKFLRVVKASR